MLYLNVTYALDCGVIFMHLYALCPSAPLIAFYDHVFEKSDDNQIECIYVRLDIHQWCASSWA